MANVRVYDDAAYHQGAAEFLVKNLPLENGGTHIGMFLAWVIIRRWESFALRQKAPDDVERVRRRELTGRALLFAHCDGRLTTEALNKHAQAFTDSYYEAYLRDFEETLADKPRGAYQVDDTWTNYDRLATLIDERFSKT